MCPTSIIRESNSLGKEQMVLVAMDVFTGQVTLEIKEVLQENSILASNVPTNMTRFYQPFDLPINGSAKGTQNRFLKSYSLEHPWKISESNCGFQS